MKIDLLWPVIVIVSIMMQLPVRSPLSRKGQWGGAMDGSRGIGAGFAEVILGLADLLKGTAAPGLVALMLFVATGVAMLFAHLRLRWACAYPRDLTRVLRREQRPISRDLIAGLHIPLPRRNYGPASLQQMRVWDAFCGELSYADSVKGGATSPVEPSVALSREALGLRLGVWRIIPGTLVGVGLVLTFLGLIAALREAGVSITASGSDPEMVKQSLSDLLTIASAKFIMSLAGLTGSILFGVFLKFWEVALERVAADLAGEVRSRVDVVSPERALRDLLASSLRTEALIKAAARD